MATELPWPRVGWVEATVRPGISSLLYFPFLPPLLSRMELSHTVKSKCVNEIQG